MSSLLRTHWSLEADEHQTPDIPMPVDDGLDEELKALEGLKELIDDSELDERGTAADLEELDKLCNVFASGSVDRKSALEAYRITGSAAALESYYNPDQKAPTRTAALESLLSRSIELVKQAMEYILGLLRRFYAYVFSDMGGASEKVSASQKSAKAAEAAAADIHTPRPPRTLEEDIAAEINMLVLNLNKAEQVMCFSSAARSSVRKQIETIAANIGGAAKADLPRELYELASLVNEKDIHRVAAMKLNRGKTAYFDHVEGMRLQKLIDGMEAEITKTDLEDIAYDLTNKTDVTLRRLTKDCVEIFGNDAEAIKKCIDGMATEAKRVEENLEKLNRRFDGVIGKDPDASRVAMFRDAQQVIQEDIKAATVYIRGAVYLASLAKAGHTVTTRVVRVLKTQYEKHQNDSDFDEIHRKYLEQLTELLNTLQTTN